MSHMSRNNSSTTLMGFSVHQPALGAPLQFFPAMGSKQLDEMIDTYVPGNKSIQDKRAAVSMEFYQHVCQTGNMFKFFTVYPSLGSTSESPASSMLDSGYASNFTSPVMSESQWTQAGNTSFSSTGSQAQKSSSQKATSSSDFSHLPGMKIMTRDGRDVTNSASRGCKTKEQRDHAHLMRIIKACEACRKKKVRCDPSHKRSSGSSGAKTTKKAKKAAPSTSPPPIAPQTTMESLDQSFFSSPSFNSLDPMNPSSSFSFDTVIPESLVDPTMEWDQFVQYNDEPTEMIPVDYDFLFDPAGYFSPVSSNSVSSSQPFTPFTPAQTVGTESVGVTAGTAEAEAQAPLPPYLNPGGEAGNDYADFSLYSPGSSTGLDDDPTLIKDLAATSGPEYSEYLSHQRQLYDGGRHGALASQSWGPVSSTNAEGQMPLFTQEEPLSSAALDSPEYYQHVSHGPIRWPYATSGDGGLNNRVSERQTPDARDRLDPRTPVDVDGPQSCICATLPSTEPSGITSSSNQSSSFRSSVVAAIEGNDRSSIASPSSARSRSEASRQTLMESSTFEFRSQSQSSNPGILDESMKSDTTILQGSLTGGVSQSVFSPSRSPQSVEMAAGRRHPSTYSTGPAVRETEQSTPATDNSGQTLGSIVANSAGTGTVLGSGKAHPVPLSSVGQGVPSSDILAPIAAIAYAAIAVCLLVLVLDLAHLKDVSSFLLHEARTISFPFASLLVAVTSTMVSKQPLSFVGRLPMAIMDGMKLPNLHLYRKISNTQSNLEREDTLRSSNGANRVPPRLSHATRSILICSY
ncbi:hypothetical protein Hte_012226 [Hypoxylon texense]